MVQAPWRGAGTPTGVGRGAGMESVRGYIWDSPLQFYMAYVVDLFCCYIPWSLVMVSVSCLVILVPCDGSDV